MPWRAPHRPGSEVTQAYSDGVVTVYAVTDAARPGYQPKPTLTRKAVLRYEEQRLGIQASNHVPDSQGGKVRGFAGIEILDRRFLVRGSIRYDRPFSPVEVSQNAP